MFRIVSLALLLVMLVTIIPGIPVQAAASLRVSPNRGKIGESIEIYGSEFEAGARYDLYFSHERAFVDDKINTNILNYKLLGTTGFITPFGTFERFFFNIPVDLRDGRTVEKVRGGAYYVYAVISADESKRIRARADFTVDALPEVTITPVEGAVGIEVKVTGTSFAAGNSVTIKFDGAQVKTATSDSNGDFSNAAFAVPESYRGSHTLEVRDASDKLATATFTTKQSIIVTPTSGAAGDNVTVSGTGFAAAKGITIKFDGIQVKTATTTSVGSFSAVTFAAPAKGAGSYNVDVVDESGNSASLPFTISGVLVNLNPAAGESDISVTVTGSGFRASKPITITFNKSNVATTTSDNSGAFTTTFKVPVLASATYKVTATDGTNTAPEADFSIVTNAGISPATSAASPGYVGMQLTVNGVGFTAGGTATVNYDGKPVVTATVGSDGKFSVNFKAPPSSDGGHIIIATDGTHSKQFAFTMESTPPSVPKPLKPEMGIKAEKDTFFDWEDVPDDPSGITYTLQIANDKDFSSIVLEKTGLTRSEYTITGKERLKSVSKDAPYYWRVKAVDGASNESQWSGTGSFYLGFSWGLSSKMTYILLGAGALLLVILGVWIGRRTAYF
ncbi:MAG: hypothetical protein HY529_06100 [Chloroflexi bacterium]|nr:hypothetical protein [Chloroflexota bacterium]